MKRIAKWVARLTDADIPWGAIFAIYCLAVVILGTGMAMQRRIREIDRNASVMDQRLEMLTNGLYRIAIELRDAPTNMVATNVTIHIGIGGGE